MRSSMPCQQRDRKRRLGPCASSWHSSRSLVVLAPGSSGMPARRVGAPGAEPFRLSRRRRPRPARSGAAAACLQRIEVALHRVELAGHVSETAGPGLRRAPLPVGAGRRCRRAPPRSQLLGVGAALARAAEISRASRTPLPSGPGGSDPSPK